MAKKGRPPVFTAELINLILELIAEGQTERAIFRRQGMPEWTTWSKYKREHPDFIPHLIRAKEDFCEVKEDEIYEISKDTSKDYHHWEETTEGPRGVTIKRGVTSDNTSVQRNKLQIDTIWRLMRSTMPKKYGDHQQLEHSGSINVQPIIELSTKKTE